MSVHALVRTIEPASEPITLAEAKSFLRVDGSEEHTDLQSFISTARDRVEMFTGRALISQTWKLVASGWPTINGYVQDKIVLERSPLISVTSIKYYPDGGGAQATLSADSYHVGTYAEPGFVQIKDDQDWPDLAARPDAVEIIFVAGYANAAAIPQTLVHCVRLLTEEFFTHRSTVNVGTINEMPRIRDLLESQRVGGWVA